MKKRNVRYGNRVMIDLLSYLIENPDSNTLSELPKKTGISKNSIYKALAILGVDHIIEDYPVSSELSNIIQLTEEGKSLAMAASLYRRLARNL